MRPQYGHFHRTPGSTSRQRPFHSADEALLFALSPAARIPMARKRNAVDFEKALSELEEQVHLLESGSLPLEEALKAFEAGIKLTRECQQALTEAEQKVQLLLEKADGSVEFSDFDTDNDPSNNA